MSMLTATEDLTAAESYLRATLFLIREATEGVPNHRSMRRVFERLAREYGASVLKGWKQPAREVFIPLLLDTFRLDLQLERAREDWRKAMRVKNPAQRHVRTDWRNRVLAMKSLTDEEKSSVISRLRATGTMEAERRPSPITEIDVGYPGQYSSWESPLVTPELKSMFARLQAFFKADGAKMVSARLHQAAKGDPANARIGGGTIALPPTLLKRLQKLVTMEHSDWLKLKRYEKEKYIDDVWTVLHEFGHTVTSLEGGYDPGWKGVRHDAPMEVIPNRLASMHIDKGFETVAGFPKGEGLAVPHSFSGLPQVSLTDARVKQLAYEVPLKDWRKTMDVWKAMDAAGAGTLEETIHQLTMETRLIDSLAKDFEMEFYATMVQAGDEVVKEIGLGGSWHLHNPQARMNMERYAGYYGDRLSKVVPLDQQEQVREAVLRGMDEGLGATETADLMRETIDQLKGYQAERLARTETIRAREEARQIVFQDSGVQEVEWVVADSPCEECDPLAGQVFPVDEAPAIPLHPNCRCTYVPTMRDLNRIHTQYAEPGEEVEPLQPDLSPRYRQTPRG
jgi:SPP1 gp7 family putative phage head morphogenesis protein